MEQYTTTMGARQCETPVVKIIPWPSIIIFIVGLILLIWLGLDGSINHNRRMFGLSLILLWTLMWMLILWLLWYRAQYNIAWWVLFIPFITLILFFVIAITMDIGV